MANTGKAGVHLSKNVLKSEDKSSTEDTQGDLTKTVDIVTHTWALVNQNALQHGIVFYKRLGYSCAIKSL
jgi:hypothetical protein